MNDFNLKANCLRVARSHVLDAMGKVLVYSKDRHDTVYQQAQELLRTINDTLNKTREAKRHAVD